MKSTVSESPGYTAGIWRAQFQNRRAILQVYEDDYKFRISPSCAVAGIQSHCQWAARSSGDGLLACDIQLCLITMQCCCVPHAQSIVPIDCREKHASNNDMKVIIKGSWTVRVWRGNDQLPSAPVITAHVC